MNAPAVNVPTECLEKLERSATLASAECYDWDPFLPLFHAYRPLAHVSHDHVLVSHAYLSSDSYLSRSCTFSHDYSALTHSYPYLRNVYIDLGTHCRTPT